MEDEKKLPEIKTTQCKVCQKLKLRIRDGDYNKRDKKWRDSDGLLWNGTTCPSCHKDKMVLRMRNQRPKTDDQQ